MQPEPDAGEPWVAPYVVATVLGGTSTESVEWAPAFEGGTPVIDDGALEMHVVSAFTVPTAEFVPFDQPTDYYDITSAWDEAYSANVPVTTGLVLELNRDPRTCTCGISVTGNQAGAAPIDASPMVPVWVAGNSVVSEQTWFPDGQFIDLLLIGD